MLPVAAGCQQRCLWASTRHQRRHPISGAKSPSHQERVVGGQIQRRSGTLPPGSLNLFLTDNGKMLQDWPTFAHRRAVWHRRWLSRSVVAGARLTLPLASYSCRVWRPVSYMVVQSDFWARRLRRPTRNPDATLPMPKTAKVKKSKPATQSNGNGIAALTAQLWQAAVNLRGSIEPADYKRYVLPIIFLRFLSIRYERRRADLERLIADPASEHHTTDSRVATEILADAAEYPRPGPPISPKTPPGLPPAPQAPPTQTTASPRRSPSHLPSKFP